MAPHLDEFEVSSTKSVLQIDPYRTRRWSQVHVFMKNIATLEKNQLFRTSIEAYDTFHDLVGDRDIELVRSTDGPVDSQKVVGMYVEQVLAAKESDNVVAKHIDIISRKFRPFHKRHEL